MHFLNAISCVICIVNVVLLIGGAFAELQTLDEVALKQALTSNRLVLAHIRSNENCDEECRENLKFLSEMQATLSSYEIHTFDMYSQKLLKPYTKEGKVPHSRLFFYRNGTPLLYEGEGLKRGELVEFVQQHSNQIYSRSLDDQTFEHETQASTGSTTGDWFILFFSPECDEYLSLWETLAARLAHVKVVASVDMAQAPISSERFKASHCPSLYFLRAGKYYKYDQPIELAKLVLFAEGWYKNAPSHPVKPLPTAFDSLLESVVSTMKDSVMFKYLVLMASAIIIITTLVILFISRIRPSTVDHSKIN